MDTFNRSLVGYTTHILIMYQESMFFWMTLSCVVAVYNEEKYLPYSLPMIGDPLFNEIVIVLDRCTDNSEAMVNKVRDGRFLLQYKDSQLWENPLAEAKNMGCSTATGDFLMITDADFILDVDAVNRGRELLLDDPMCDAVVFTYNQYSFYSSVFHRIKDIWINLLWKLIRRGGFMPTRSGIYLIRKNSAIIPDKPSEYDYLQRNLRTTSITSRSLHLRPKRSKEDQYTRGRTRSQLAQYSLMRTVIMSILLLEPYLLTGYLEGRQR